MSFPDNFEIILGKFPGAEIILFKPIGVKDHVTQGFMKLLLQLSYCETFQKVWSVHKTMFQLI